MNQLQGIIFLLSLATVSSNEVKNMSKSLPKALVEITNSLLNSSSYFSIINFNFQSKMESRVFDDIKVPHKVLDVNISTLRNRFEVQESGIVVVESVKALKYFNSKAVLANSFSKDMRLYVYVKKTTIDELKYNDFESRNIAFSQYFLVENEFTIDLLTYVPSPVECESLLTTKVNSFDKKTEKWINSEFYFEKFKNFYGCKLIFSILLQSESFVANYNHKTKTNDYSGYTHDIFAGISSQLNYEYVPIPWSEDFGVRSKHSSLFIYVKAFKDLDSQSESFAFLTKVFLFYDEIIAVPPGQAFNAYEKLLSPFDYHIWLMVVVTFCIAILTIFIVSFSSEFVKNLVFGKNIHSPILNVATIFFGMALNTLPRKNFSRYLMMMFILYSLVIRTCYQSKMFEHMQQVREILKNSKYLMLCCLLELSSVQWH
jgi:hypothetical protein